MMREDFDDAFDGPKLSLLRQDITRLMKAAGRTETAMDMKKSMVQCLDMFAVGTDLPKKAPSPPKPHDLGLLREKCHYESSAKKAERVVQQKDDVLKDVVGNLSTILQPTLNEQYMSGQLTIDALSVVFGRPKLQVLIDKEATMNDSDDDNNKQLPIAFELLRERASPHLIKLEYKERNDSTMKVADQWETALLQWTNERGRVRRRFENVAPSNGQVSKKRKAKQISKSTETSHKICCVRGCDGSGSNSELKRVSEYPAVLPENSSQRRQITYAVKRFQREERTERLGYGRECNYTELRACKKHWVYVEGKSVNAPIWRDGKKVATVFTTITPFLVPEYVGGKSFAAPPKKMSRGNATDRAILRHVTDLSENEYALAQQQIIEMQEVHDGTLKLEHINSTVLSAAGLDVHIDASSSDESESNSTSDLVDTTDDSWRVPTITLKDLVPKEVKRRTNFNDLKHLLSFVSATCGGDLSLITRTSSILTWLEEWILYFELVSGRTIIRFSDYATIYNCREQTLREVVREKVRLVLATRERWPMYASYAEDAKFRDSSWSGHFDPVNGHRVIMHDSTNIPLAQPTCAALQRALYNSYYGMCCAKGGVAVQLCGYIYGLPLNTGHSDDTRFIEDTKILEKQQQFAENDTSSTKPFLNIFDKGYQCVLEAKDHGGQFCMQPAFAESEKQFKSNAVLYSGAVAVVRSGNERAVNRCKMSWFLKRGAREQMWNIDLVCDIWEAWTFQVNFMYETFL